MNRFFTSRLLRRLIAWAPVVLAFQAADVAAQGQGQSRRYDQQIEKVNAWTVGLAGGLIEGAPLRLAAEMARVVDDGPNMHVLPIVTRGATGDLTSLLYLRGVALAIATADVVDEYKSQVPDMQRHPAYLPDLFPHG